ncbi:condensation domain-containing protein [Streptomyces sp. SAS_269]|uniref:condensation domain-containing protein n=1 Tax=Streptomyces sp. SAS_269 TaxID=3412749 RepID=UPI00403C44CA
MLAADSRRHFDPAMAPLFRLTLIRMAERGFELIVTSHHLMFDGWSLPLVLRDLIGLYEDRGDASALPRPRNYRDFLVWRSRQDRGVSARAWAEELAGVTEPTLLAPQARAADTAGGIGRAEVGLSPQGARELVRRAADMGVTINTVVQGAWAILLGQLTARNDVLFGMTVSGRPPQLAGVDEMLGLFINTLPVRAHYNPGDSLTKVMTDLQGRQTGLLDHHHHSLAEIQEGTGLRTLFDSVVVFESYPWDGAGAQALSDSGVTISRFRYSTGTRYAMTLMAAPEPLRMSLQYQRGVFESTAVERMAERYLRVLEQIIADPDVPVATVEVLTAEERELLEQKRPATATATPRGAVVHDPSLLPGLFEAAVAASPDAVAVLDGSRSLTYAELDARANALAFELIEHGAGPDRPVAVTASARRSVESVVALLAVAKAGGVYLPLETDAGGVYLPLRTDASRVVGLPADVGAVNDADAVAVLAVRESAAVLPETPVPYLYLDEPRAGVERAPVDADRRRPLRPQHLAHVAGTPASNRASLGGTGITHHNVTALVARLTAQLGMGPGVRLMAGPSASTDVRTVEAFTALSTGATLDLTEDPVGTRPGGPWTRTVLSTRPSRFTAMPGGATQDVDTVLFSGEPLPAELVAKVRAELPETRVLHWYGHPETGTATTLTIPHTEEWTGTGHPPLGLPLPDVQALVLGPGFAPVPPRVTGELYLAGPGLGRGYLGAPGRTAARFVANPFDPAGARMYRTGDLVRRLRTGELVHVGRVDDRPTAHSAEPARAALPASAPPVSAPPVSAPVTEQP